MVKAAQEFHEVVTDKVNGLPIVFLYQLIFTIVIVIISINYIIDITLTNILVGSGGKGTSTNINGDYIAVTRQYCTTHTNADHSNEVTKPILNLQMIDMNKKYNYGTNDDENDEEDNVDDSDGDNDGNDDDGTRRNFSNFSNFSNGNSKSQKLIERKIAKIILDDVISHVTAGDLLMQHLGNEFSMECLLSLITFIQFETYILNCLIQKDFLDKKQRLTSDMSDDDNQLQHKLHNTTDDIDVKDDDAVANKDDEYDYDKHGLFGVSSQLSSTNIMIEQLKNESLSKKYQIKLPNSIPKSEIGYDEF